MWASALVLCAGGVLAAHPRVVLLVSTRAESAAARKATDGLELAVRGQLDELAVPIATLPSQEESWAANSRLARKAAASEPTLAVVWFEQHAHEFTVFFYDPSGPHLYSRRVDAGSFMAVSEEVAIVVRSAVGAVLEGGSVSMAELSLPTAAVAAPPAPPPPAPKSAEPERRGGLWLGASYVGTLYALEAPWQHGVAISAAFAAAKSPWFAGVSYTYFPPLALESARISTQLQRHPGEAFVGAQLRLASLLFVVEGAVVGDRVDRATLQVPEGLTAAADGHRWQWALSSRLGCTISLTPRVRGMLNLGAEFLLSRFDHVVEIGPTTQETLAAPMPARPRVELGLEFDVW